MDGGNQRLCRTQRNPLKSSFTDWSDQYLSISALPGSGNMAVNKTLVPALVNQVQLTDHLITACNEGPEENEWESGGECTGVLLRAGGLGKTEGVSLNLRLKGGEGASWPCSEQREESSSRRNNKDLGGIGGNEWWPVGWKSVGEREDQQGG